MDDAPINFILYIGGQTEGHPPYIIPFPTLDAANTAHGNALAKLERTVENPPTSKDVRVIPIDDFKDLIIHVHAEQDVYNLDFDEWFEEHHTTWTDFIVDWTELSDFTPEEQATLLEEDPETWHALDSSLKAPDYPPDA